MALDVGEAIPRLLAGRFRIRVERRFRHFGSVIQQRQAVVLFGRAVQQCVRVPDYQQPVLAVNYEAAAAAQFLFAQLQVLLGEHQVFVRSDEHHDQY